ncbi:insulinase family protein [Magnetofaba australis]|nr:insulinase family protein [Magnetofaba australis]
MNLPQSAASAADQQSDGFVLQSRAAVEALNIVVESYRHQRTGARHIHLASDDPQNTFLVAFLTVPQDSTGVAHILEHTALCGSQRYPVRDPFFMMLRRTLATFMNAFTSSDWTAYPFSTLSRKDFDNLLDVYLDAAFFPNLDEMDFLQEGRRIEPAEEGDPEAELVYKGVVFNEMKGAMSSPVRVLWERMSHHLFPTTTYHYNSGGDPECIPDLTWEGLRAFHAKHYHPSNAVFFTYGDIPAAEHQMAFEGRVLSKFEPIDVSDLAVPDEQRFSAPKVAEEVYALEGEEDLTGKTHITLSWLLGPASDLSALLRGHLLSSVLLDNSSSPLMQALETTDLGSAPSPVCGLDDSQKEMAFACGLEGSDPDKAEAVERLILDVLEQVARDGVEPERVEAALHQLELSRREITGDGMPYGLKLILTALPAALHGGDPLSVLALEEALATLREESQDPRFIANLTQQWLLDNPHRLRMTLKPDPQLSEQRKEREKARLEAVRQQLSAAEKQALVEQAAALKARQEQEDNPELLPKVTVADAPKDLRIPEGEERTIGAMRATWFDRPTNGLDYLQLVCELPDFEAELFDELPLFAACLPEVGSGGRDYLQTQALQAQLTGGVSARAAVRAMAQDAQTYNSRFVVSGKALARNSDALAQLLGETLAAPRFDELPRLRELIAQLRAAAESRITDNGHGLAMSAACRGMSPTARLSDRWGGLVGVRRLKALDKSLDEPKNLAAFAERLQAIGEKLAQAPRQLLAVSEAPRFESLADSLNARLGGLSSTPLSDAFTLGHRPEVVRVGWSANSQVHFCAKAYPAVSYTHPDAPALMVLGPFLRNGFLHTAIREKGGAYGGGAGFDHDAAAFRFYSYRDPRLTETLGDFDRAVQWLLDGDHKSRQLEEAVLGVVGGIDRPGSPSGEARQAFHNALYGRTPDVRRAFRQGVLKVTMADLMRVAQTYLLPDSASIAVVSSSKSRDERDKLGLASESL